MLSSKDLAFHKLKKLDIKYARTRMQLNNILNIIEEILESKPKKQEIIDTLKEIYVESNKQ